MSASFDFETLIDRNGTGACKWDRRTDAEKRAGIVPMSIADMEFPCAPCVRDALVDLAERGLYGYTDPEERYFRALRGWLLRRHRLDVPDSEIVCLHGIVPALSVAVRAFTNEGDGVIVQSPVYYPFGDMVRKNGRTLVENPLLCENGAYRMDLDGLRKLAAMPRNKLLLLCSPHNPVGRVWTAAELTELAEICLANGVLVVSDEIHFDLVLHGVHTPILQVPGLRARSVLLCSASKTFNLPGLQLANAVIPDPDLRARFRARLTADGYSNISQFGYAAAIAAYERGDAWTDALLVQLIENERAFRAFFAARFPSIPISPLEGTYLAWADFRAFGLAPDELARFLRERAGLILDDGLIFGAWGEGFERFNIALPMRILTAALDRLDRAAREIGR